MLKRFLTAALIALLPIIAACDTGASAPEDARRAPATERPAGTAAAPADHETGDVPKAAPPAGESRNPIAKMFSSAPEYREITIPAGTVLPVNLETTVGSASSHVEDPVRGTLRRAIVVDGYEALPAGSTLSGVVTNARRSGRVKGRAQVALRFNTLQANGEQFDVRTGTVSRTAPATKKQDAAKIGVGAGAGAVIGGVVGGGSGAAKGAAIGGAGGTGVVLATRGKDVTLPSGTNLGVKLLEPITVRVPVKK